MHVEWISVDDHLPLQENPDEKVVDEFLVTVYPKDLDDDGAVLILWFQAGSDHFSALSGPGFPYEDGHAHFVTHWAELPSPAAFNKEEG